MTDAPKDTGKVRRGGRRTRPGTAEAAPSPEPEPALDPETEAAARLLGAEMEADHPGLALAKLLFLQARIASGMEPRRAVVATRRRFATPKEPEARRRVAAAREGLVAAGVLGVGTYPGHWTVDKLEVYILTRLPPERARDLVEDATGAFIQSGVLDRPSPDIAWWYVDDGWRSWPPSDGRE